MRSFKLDKLLLCAGESLHALEERLQDLRQQEYPSDASQELVVLFDHIAGRLRGQLLARKDDAAAADLSNVGQYETLAVSVSRLTLLVAYLYQWLEVIDMSGKGSGLRAMAVPLEEIVAGVDKGSRILTSPTYDENYSFIDVIDAIQKRFSSALGVGEVTSLLAEYPSHVASVTFPRSAQENVLQNALVAHEIGHLVDAVHQLSLGAGTACSIAECIGQRIDLWVAENAGAEDQDSFETSEKRALLNRWITQLLEEWIGELVADLFAVQLWGFASLCATGDFLFTRTMGASGTQACLDLWTDRHPSLRFRLGILVDEIQRVGVAKRVGDEFREPVEREIAGYRELVDAPAGASHDVGETLEGYLMLLTLPDAFVLARGILDEKRDELRDAILERLDECKCVGSEPDYAQASCMAELLSDGIPPCEIVEGANRKPVGIGEILNGGWLLRVAKPILPVTWLSEKRIEESFEKRVRTQDRLIRRGIDLSQMIRTYQARRGEIEHPGSF